MDYVQKNYSYEPVLINKVIPIMNWYGSELQRKYNIEFIPTKILIISHLGTTDKQFHCVIKYRQNMEPLKVFIPKTALMGNMFYSDYHNINVDFMRYDRITNEKQNGRVLRPHQKDAVQFLLSRKKCILADEMGLGKSMSLAVASIEGNFDSIVIICPASLKQNWKDELMWYIPEKDISIVDSLMDKTKTELEHFLGYAEGKSGLKLKELQDQARENGKWSNNRYVIVNFDILNEFYKIPKTRSQENINKALNESPLLQYILNRKSLIIIDEAHRLSNNDSDRYNIIKDLIKRGKPDSIYLSTGTPITNNPQNFYNLLQLIGDPIADDWDYYSKEFCGARKIPMKGEKDKWTAIFLKRVNKLSWYDLTPSEKSQLYDFISNHARMIRISNGADNLDELRQKTSHIYLRRTKEDLGNMPNKTVHELFYTLTPTQKTEYDRLWDEYETEKRNENPDKEINKELLEGAIYRKYCSNITVPYSIKLAEQFISKDEKVIIACCYDEELYTLKEYFGDKCVIYNGKMSLKEKEQAKNEFINNLEKKVFIGNIIAAGVGITLTVSHIVIFNNMSFVPSDNRQMEDRVYRIGQTHDVDIYYQIFQDTQYEKMWNTVLKKELIINTVIKKEDEK